MPRGWRRATRRLVGLALALLLLAPLVAGAHVHGVGADPSAACSVCTIVKHVPAMVGAASGVATAAFRAEGLLDAPAAAPAHGECRRPAGRAPPAFSSIPPA
jgi:hypothetical protein